MEFITEKLLIELYSKYINDDQYVFFKDHDIIIIMKKIDDSMQCIFNNYPKKYYSSSLKVILMFNITDPYKLVHNASKYKINNNIASHCYLTIYHLQNFSQIFYINGQVARETTSFGLNQEYYDNGQLRNEYYCEYGSIYGLYTQYHENRQLMYQCNYYQGYINDYYIEYYDNGYIYEECEYIKGNKHGLYRKYHDNGNIHIECEYIKGNKHGLYRKYHNNGNIHIECIYELDKIKN
jgi:antitoxin component YwqK of YwqJK toxin-antitoxin module